MKERTMKEAVVFETPSAEQSIEGVHSLFLRYILSKRTIDIRSTFRRQCSRISKFNISEMNIKLSQTQRNYYYYYYINSAETYTWLNRVGLIDLLPFQRRLHILFLPSLSRYFFPVFAVVLLRYLISPTFWSEL